MSTHYLIDAHTTPIGNSKINDVRISTDGRSVMNGNFVVRVPDGVKLESEPTDLADLLTQKYQGILAHYPGFTNIIYDDLLDADDIDPTGTSTATYKAGERGTLAYNNNAQPETTLVDVSPAVVAQCVVLVEFYRIRYSNSKSGRLERIYEEAEDVMPGTTPIEVSADGGANFSPTYNGTLLEIPALEQGSSVQLKFSTIAFNPTGGTYSSEPLYLGSWALLY